MSVKTQAGGMFDTRKVQYSLETHKLLKLLMDEVKLTTAQRQKMNESLKRGEPLPVIRRRRHRPSHVDENLFDLKKNYYFRRRTQNQIMHSGAYQRERYRFLERTVDLEKEKEKLRDIMEYGKRRKGRAQPPSEAPPRKAGGRESERISPEERLAELANEIEDRLDFLKEMKALGQGKKYEATIEQEIAAKLREMEKMDGSLARKHSSGPRPSDAAPANRNSDKSYFPK